MSASGSPARRSELQPVAVVPILLAAAAAVVVLMIFAGRYGYHRDELYFLVAARRLAWGYVDQPPFTPLIARLSEVLAGGSLLALRTFPALFTAATVVLTALCAREMGAGRLGQSASAVAIAASPGVLGAGHLLSTTTPDLTLWIAITLVTLRILRTQNVRLWVVVGTLVGIGSLNKWTIGFLVIGLLAGVLAGPERRLLATPWFLAGVALAVALWAPDLVWQAGHGWPQLEMMFSIQQQSADLGASIAWVPLQFAITGPIATPLWIAGLLRVFRKEEGHPFRPLGIAYLALAVPLAIVAGDKPYYVAAMYMPLAGAGAVPFERWWAQNRGRAKRVAVPLALGMLTLASLPIVLPVLPARTLADVPLQEVNYDLGEQIGWPTFVAQVGRAWRAIPVEERSRAIILASNYGEAGAIERYGKDLPRPYSGHNTYWWWRTPPRDTAVILVVGLFDEGYLGRFFEDVKRIGRIDNGLGVQNEEQGAGIWVCRKPREPLPQMWPELRHYD